MRFLKSLAKVKSLISCWTCYSFQTSFCFTFLSSKFGTPNLNRVLVQYAIIKSEGSNYATRK